MYIKEYRRNIVLRCLIAWIATVAAVLLSTFPGISDLLNGRRPVYDPGLAILTATLIAIIWYVYWTYRVVLAPSIEKKIQRRFLKEGISTALLAELQWLEYILRGIYNKQNWHYYDITYPMLEHAEQNLHIFSSDTIGKIATFHYRLLRVKSLLRDKITGEGESRIMQVVEMEAAERKIYGVDHNIQQQIRKLLDKALRENAVLAAQVLVELVSSLYQEGGSKPAALKRAVSAKDEPPPLSPCAFPEPEDSEMND